MSLETDIQTLRSEIGKSLSVSARIEGYILNFQREKLNDSPGLDEAMSLTQAFTNYYTCMETLFLRVSKFFENNLGKERWHRSLLEKMTLEIDEVRPRVISETVYQGLVEFLKFRHVARYYFELDYDWDKLGFLLKKFNDIHVRVRKELAEFDSFLKRLLES